MHRKDILTKIFLCPAILIPGISVIFIIFVAILYLWLVMLPGSVNVSIQILDEHGNPVDDANIIYMENTTFNAFFDEKSRIVSNKVDKHGIFTGKIRTFGIGSHTENIYAYKKGYHLTKLTSLHGRSILFSGKNIIEEDVIEHDGRSFSLPKLYYKDQNGDKVSIFSVEKVYILNEDKAVYCWADNLFQDINARTCNILPIPVLIEQISAKPVPSTSIN